MRIRWIALAITALFFGALGGTLLAPQPANAVNKDMVELQQTVSQIQAGQQDLRSAIDSNNATLRTLIQQSLDSVQKMNSEMGTLQRTVQEVQANTGSRIDSLTQQTQGISDNLQDMQSRVGKLSQQLGDMQNVLQSIDSKVSGAGTPSTAPPPSSGNSYSPPPSSGAGAPPANGAAAMTPAGGGSSLAAMPPISADTLYKNALRDFTTGNYDLSHQEFSDYIRNFPSTDLASNAQFYLGEIRYAQGNYEDAIQAYDVVLTKYRQSFKLAGSLLRKAQAENQLKMKTSAIRDLREVVSRFPGSDESRKARSLLQQMGAPVTAHGTAPH